MKRVISTISVVALLMGGISVSAQAQMSDRALNKVQKQKDKADKNWYKKKTAEYEKDGWKISGSTKTLEVALLEHQLKLNKPGNIETVGQVSQCKSIGVCKAFALTQAQNNYAQKASGHVKGRIEAIMRADDNETAIEMNKFIAAYESMVKAEVGGVLTESFSVVKDNGTTKEYETYFIINEEQALAARKKALERSLLETKLAVKEAEEISKFVNEGFDLAE
jgi:hypothetical protein